MSINLLELSKGIDSLLQYFIPGYIVICIKRYFRNDLKNNEKHTFIMSIVLTYIINIIYEFLIYLFSIFFAIIICPRLLYFNFFTIVRNLIDIFLENDSIRAIVIILISIICAYVLIIFPESLFNKNIHKFLKSKNLPDSTVWSHVMQKKNNVWVKVYLKDLDIAYIGMLINYSIQGKDKELYLQSFISYKISSSEEIENYSDDEKKSVLIKCSGDYNIEIFED